MTSDQLRRELSRLADTVPDPEIARDTWPRARRSLGRDRLAGAAAVVAVVAGVVLAGAPFVRTPSQEGPFALPATLSTAGDEDLPVETDLAVGTAAAAYPSQAADGSMHVVVVSAVDDAHHALALPDLPAAANRSVWSFGQPIRLSPDGRELAFVTAPSGTTDGASGVSVLDLATGELRTAPLPGPVGVPALTWSPAGRYLAWYGGQIQGSELTSRGAGLLDPDGSITALPANVTDLAPGDDGSVALLRAGKPIRLWKDGRTVDTIDDGPVGRDFAAQLEDGVVSELRSVVTPEDPVPGYYQLLMRHGPDPDSGRLATGLGATRQAFGWTAGGALLVTKVSNGSNGSWPTRLYRLALDHGKVTAETVMTLDVQSSQLTLATGLPTEGAPEDQPEPAWPWLVGGGALLLLAAGVLLLGLRSALKVRRDLRLA